MTTRPLPPLLLRLPLPAPAASLIGLSFSAFLRRIAGRKPSILSRLGRYESALILIDVGDGPLILLMQPSTRRITAHARDGAEPEHYAAIRGELAAFLAMLHGSEDGDALFFSGELEISGDTSVVQALRNALDDAELDLTEELALMAGPLSRWLRRFAAMAETRTGYALIRRELF
ncbi:hypothetical protein GL300_21115 [Paracoccus litorisediminis]|uniref:SCP2 domain-containing protein n=2 Tax=Paracoccus litorisediminis TaxID=2006130 RepID=A0A844HTE7_9RHOB|nr:hypothetical protein [Paracoccus litorisediminis]